MEAIEPMEVQNEKDLNQEKTEEAPEKNDKSNKEPPDDQMEVGEAENDPKNEFSGLKIASFSSLQEEKEDDLNEIQGETLSQEDFETQKQTSEESSEKSPEKEPEKDDDLAEISEVEPESSEKDAENTEKDAENSEKDAEISEKDDDIAEISEVETENSEKAGKYKGMSEISEAEGEKSEDDIEIATKIIKNTEEEAKNTKVSEAESSEKSKEKAEKDDDISEISQVEPENSEKSKENSEKDDDISEISQVEPENSEKHKENSKKSKDKDDDISIMETSSPEKSSEKSKEPEKSNENSDKSKKNASDTEDIVTLDDDEPDENGIKITSVTSESSSGLKIASFSSINSEKESENGGLKISSFASLSKNSDKDEEIVNLDDKSKPVLKLASFAEISSNGISASEIVQDSSSDSSGIQCGQNCGKNLPDLKAGVAWETMKFCNDKCLGLYQDTMNNCSTCKIHVQTAFLGKYCVRFGSNIKQFCSNKCLEDHKKGLKVCCYCQKDISSGDGFLAPIGNKGQFKDFCYSECLQKYEAKHFGKPIEKEIAKCAVCNLEKPVESELILEDKTIKLCSEICLGAYKFANNLADAVKCDLCNKETPKNYKNGKVIYFGGKSNRFCSEACQNVFVMQSREIVPCSWCKVRKYNFDMIERYGDAQKEIPQHFCSVNCLKLYGSGGTTGAKKQAIVVHSSGKGSPVSVAVSTSTETSIPVIQSVSSLAGTSVPGIRPDALPTTPIPPSQLSNVQVQAPTQVKVVTETIVKAPEAPEQSNKSISCKPFMLTKGVSCRPHPCHKSSQTDLPSTPALLPITLPMFMPVPMQMYNRPYPVPVPIPIPVPVPVFIPTTRNSQKGVEKLLRKLKAKIPSDPLEAELLALAGAVSNNDDLISDSEDSAPETESIKEPNMNLNESNNVKKYSEDIENIMAGSNIVPKPLPQVTPDSQNSAQNWNNPAAGNRFQNQRTHAMKRRHSGKDADSDEEERATLRSTRRGRAKQARTSISNESNNVAAFTQPPKERPDAKNHLKFTYGVNAWRHWVVGKNAELEKARAQGKYIKPFETDILKLRADELNYTLCMFVKEVRKPNGDIYASDSVLYLALGIQEYLFENGRIDNIFTDTYYDAFTTALHEVIKDFKLPTNEMGYFVTRIEEEHLWEAKQLGAHSPQVLLNTLIYFNVKYFMLKTTEEHKKLSFTHIMKHYKKGGTATPVTRNSAPSPGEKQTLLLRYYPPSDSRPGGRHNTRKCYEQHEIPDQTRCPVKLYEFYLSKCTDNVRTRSDLFYLQPERSCVPDSPVWFSSSQELPEYQIDKMLQRILMVREVQEHMLADGQELHR